MYTHLLLLHTGYVESQSTQCLSVFYNSEKPEMDVDEVEKFKEKFLSVFEPVTVKQRAKCCPHCNKSLGTETTFTREEVARNFIYEFIKGTSDSTTCLYDDYHQALLDIGIDVCGYYVVGQIKSITVLSNVDNWIYVEDEEYCNNKVDIENILPMVVN